MNKKQLFALISITIVIFLISCVSIYTLFQYNNLHKNYAILQNLNKELSDEINNLNIKLTEKDTEIKTNQEQILTLNKEIQTLSEENNKLKSEITNLNKKINNTNISTQPTQTQVQTIVPTNKTAYLTFDDGPSNNTITILDTLKENNIKATFFINGNYNKNIVQRIINEGHAIGNHTSSHNYKKIYASTDAFLEDFNSLENSILNDFGTKSTLIRFPGGSNNTVSHNYGGKTIMDELTKLMTEKGYTYFDWNVTSGDADSTPATKEQIISNVVNRSKTVNNAIILMHDSSVKTETAKAVPEIIKQLKELGFSFDKLSETAPKVQFK